MADNTVNEGTAFPGSPVQGQEFFRTDLDANFVYYGSTWSQVLPNAQEPASPGFYVHIAAGVATNTTIKKNAGKLYTINVESTGTAAMQFTDGAGGTPIVEIPSGAAIGPIAVDADFQNSLVAVGAAGNPAVTVQIDTEE